MIKNIIFCSKEDKVVKEELQQLKKIIEEAEKNFGDYEVMKYSEWVEKQMTKEFVENSLKTFTI